MLLGIEMRQPCNSHGGTENSNLTKTHRAFKTAAFELGRGVTALVPSACRSLQIVLPMNKLRGLACTMQVLTSILPTATRQLITL